MRSYWEIIGQAIREARQETEESQRNTALRLGLIPSDYVRMEDGEDNPDVVLDALMRALRERDEAREALRELWQSADAYIPSLDETAANRWRKIAGLEDAK